MLRFINFIAQFLIVVGLFTSGQVFGATRLEPLTVGYSNITATYAPLWIAVEERVGIKYGLDLKAIYAGRVRPQQLLATGDDGRDRPACGFFGRNREICVAQQVRACP
jgi:hypothetical protein